MLHEIRGLMCGIKHALRDLKRRYQIGAVLFHELPGFVVGEARVFYRCHPGAHCVLDPFWTMSMCRHTQPKICRFLHRGTQFLRREFSRLHVAVVG
jgi:hypothetical protein